MKSLLKTIQKSKFGFSLLEIILSMVILTMTAIGVMSVLSGARGGSARVEDQMTAVQILNRRMAEIKEIYINSGTIDNTDEGLNRGIEFPPAWTDVHFSIDVQQSNNSSGEDLVNYDPSQMTGLRRVKLHLAWRNSVGVPQDLELASWMVRI